MLSHLSYHSLKYIVSETKISSSHHKDEVDNAWLTLLLWVLLAAHPWCYSQSSSAPSQQTSGLNSINSTCANLLGAILIGGTLSLITPMTMQ